MGCWLSCESYGVHQKEKNSFGLYNVIRCDANRLMKQHVPTFMVLC